MSKLDDHFFAELASDLKPGRHWRPSTRALILGASFLALNIIGMLAVRPFRPMFLEQLFAQGRFALEISSAALLTGLLIYLCFHLMVPGKKLTNGLLALGTLSLLGLVATLVASFYKASPVASLVGARPLCVEEVLVYGLLGMGSFIFVARRSHFQFSRWQYFTMGVASGLVPGVLMQVACMYAPTHSLILHYGPSLALGALGAIFLPLFKRH